jgi:type III restriction enzyme
MPHSHVVLDSNWEAKLVEMEEMDEVLCYVRIKVGFTIPYTLNGEEHGYLPDHIVRLTDGHGRDDPLNLILEVSGEARKDKAAKVATARNLWVPAINNHGGYGRWAFIEITDPWDARTRSARCCAARMWMASAPVPPGGEWLHMIESDESSG